MRVKSGIERPPLSWKGKEKQVGVFATKSKSEHPRTRLKRRCKLEPSLEYFFLHIEARKHFAVWKNEAPLTRCSKSPQAWSVRLAAVFLAKRMIVTVSMTAVLCCPLCAKILASKLPRHVAACAVRNQRSAETVSAKAPPQPRSFAKAALTCVSIVLQRVWLFVERYRTLEDLLFEPSRGAAAWAELNLVGTQITDLLYRLEQCRFYAAWATSNQNARCAPSDVIPIAAGLVSREEPEGASAVARVSRVEQEPEQEVEEEEEEPEQEDVDGLIAVAAVDVDADHASRPSNTAENNKPQRNRAVPRAQPPAYRLPSTAHPTKSKRTAHRSSTTRDSSSRDSSSAVWPFDRPLPPRQLNDLYGKHIMLYGQSGRHSDYFLVRAALQALGVELVHQITATVHAVVVNAQPGEQQRAGPSAASASRSATGSSMGSRLLAAASSARAQQGSPAMLNESIELARRLGVRIWTWSDLLAEMRRLFACTASDRLDLSPCSYPRIIVEDKAGIYKPVVKVFTPQRTIISSTKGAVVVGRFPVNTAPIVDWNARGHGSPFVRGEGNLTQEGQPAPPFVATTKPSSKFCEVCERTFSTCDSEHMQTPEHQRRYNDPTLWSGRERLDEMERSQRESDELWSQFNQFPLQWTDAQCGAALTLFAQQAEANGLPDTNEPVNWREFMRGKQGYEVDEVQEQRLLKAKQHKFSHLLGLSRA